MKWIALSLMAIAAIAGGLWLALGGVGFLILVIASLVVAVGCGCYWLGHNQALIGVRIGADIALRAQESDDRRDRVQATQFAGLVREGVKIGQQQARIDRPAYPQLPFGGETADGDFTIEIDGLEQ